MTEPTFYTIGHSTRPLETFIEMLSAAGVRLVADVRRFPGSRSYPAYNKDALPDSLQKHQIGYAHFPDLGGRRAKRGDIRDPRNGWWQNASFHNYADYALSAPFQTALERLIETGCEKPLAMMCSEAVWWRCHRRIIADYLMHRGYEVVHLMGQGREVPAKPTPAATDAGNNMLIYPPQD